MKTVLAGVQTVHEATAVRAACTYGGTGKESGRGSEAERQAHAQADLHQMWGNGHLPLNAAGHCDILIKGGY